MNLQNGYKVIYEKIANGKRTFYATKTNTCDPAVDDKIVEATIGEYKLIYEKDGQFFGSKTGIPAANDYCFADFDKVFKVVEEEEEDETPADPQPSQGDAGSGNSGPEGTDPDAGEQTGDQGNDAD